MDKPSVFIIGAGPTGLTCAIELARRGIPVRIIEKKSEPEHISKAIGINPRSLTLLEASGVTPRLLTKGLKLNRMRMHYGDDKQIAIHLDKIPHKYNFLIALPQDETETILEERLNELGVKVERVAELDDLIETGQGYEALIKSQWGSETIRNSLIIGADGAHSMTRKQINVDFEGIAIEEPWYLADVHIDWPYQQNGHDAQAFFQQDGTVGLTFPLGGTRYRLLSNREEVFGFLPKPYSIEDSLWESQFKLSCRLAQTFQKANVFLAGDAAHIHTPVGGRGMNLGIEDACVLADYIDAGKTDRYTTDRRPAARHVINMTTKFYNLMTTQSPMKIWARNHFMLPLLKFSAVQKQQLKMISGL
ncbi:MAG: hypothetical protein CMF50_02610 [Legionellales bacterium]|nr:hypothetical protein [Legionellales bacterium]|tara:strand:- start:9983 stop:11068 length:1086 start_codon:yes stop_codon:yes gene_type:complete